MGTKYSIDSIVKMGANEDVIKSLIKQIQEDQKNSNRKIVPFIGAGISVDYGYSLWGETLRRIADTFCTNDEITNMLNNGRYIDAADALCSENPVRFKEKLRDLCSSEGKDFSSRDKSAFFISRIFRDGLLITTNYDSVFEEVYSCNGYVYNVVTPAAAGILQNMLKSGNNNQHIIYKFHGDVVTSNDGDLIITADDYNRLYTESKDLLGSFEVLAERYSFLFLGSSLNFESEQPDRFLQLIDNVSTQKNSNRHYAILPFVGMEETTLEEDMNRLMKERYNKMCREHNIEPIFYPDGEHGCVREILRYISDSVNNSDRKKEKTEVNGKLPQKTEEVQGDVKKTKGNAGALLVYGMNSCTMYEIVYPNADSQSMDACKKVTRWDYSVECPKKNETDRFGEFEEMLITLTCDMIIPYIREKYQGLCFTKIVADAAFQDEGMPFWKKEWKNDFVEKFYTKTKLFFNILDRNQIETNLSQLFDKELTDATIIVDIGSTSVELYRYTKKETVRFESLVIDINGRMVEKFMQDNNIASENLNEKNLKKIQKYIRSVLEGYVNGVRADKAIIIKSEKTYMEKLGFIRRRKPSISIEDYKHKNKEVLYTQNYDDTINKKFNAFEPDQREAFRGYRAGHMILEVLFEMLGVKMIIPSDLHSIHGSSVAYVSQVVLSGSTKGKRRKDMERAYHFFYDQLGIDVSSPDIDQMDMKDEHSYREHAKRIRSCDLLFVCDADGYLGAQTKCDIYGAYLLSTPIAYWREPVENVESGELDYSTFIPHEVLGGLLEANNDENQKNGY